MLLKFVPGQALFSGAPPFGMVRRVCVPNASRDIQRALLRGGGSDATRFPLGVSSPVQFQHVWEG